MKRRVTVSVSSDEIALIRSKLASVGVQIADLRVALGAQQARVREALLGLGDGGRDGAGAAPDCAGGSARRDRVPRGRVGCAG